MPHPQRTRALEAGDPGTSCLLQVCSLDASQGPHLGFSELKIKVVEWLGENSMDQRRGLWERSGLDGCHGGHFQPECVTVRVKGMVLLERHRNRVQ